MTDDSFRFPVDLTPLLFGAMPPRFGVQIAHSEPQSREFVRLEILDRRTLPLTRAQVFLVHQFQQLEGEFEFCNKDFPFVQRIAAVFEDDGVVITVGTRVDDRANHRRAVGSPLEVVFRTSIPWDARGSDSSAALLVHRAVKEAILHEVAESFYVGGRRPFDPHKVLVRGHALDSPFSRTTPDD
jgi:hypothetical protein